MPTFAFAFLVAPRFRSPGLALACSPWLARLLTGSLARSLTVSLARSLARPLAHSLAPLLARSRDRPLASPPSRELRTRPALARSFARSSPGPAAARPSRCSAGRELPKVQRSLKGACARRRAVQLLRLFVRACVARPFECPCLGSPSKPNFVVFACVRAWRTRLPICLQTRSA